MPIAEPQSPVECHGDTLEKRKKIDFGETEPAQSEKQKKQSALCYITLSHCVIHLCHLRRNPKTISPQITQTQKTAYIRQKKKEGLTNVSYPLDTSSTPYKGYMRVSPNPASVQTDHRGGRLERVGREGRVAHLYITLSQSHVRSEVLSR